MTVYAGARRPRTVVLVVLDDPPARSELLSQLGPYPVSTIGTGRDMGLSPGDLARSEVGYLAMTTGRELPTDRVRIDAAVRSGSLPTNSVVRGIIGRAKDLGGRLHLIGRVSDDGVDSSLVHLYALIEIAKKARVRIVVHAILDGREGASGSSPRYIADLEHALSGGVGRIGTVAGRFWGMDVENRWDRTQKSYRAILAEGVERVDSALRGIEERYAAGKSDDVVEPFVVFDYPGVSPVDAAIHFHCRAQGARQLTRALTAPSFDAFPRKGGRGPFAGRFASLTTLEPSLDLPAAFPKTSYSNTLPEVLARVGYRQLRCAATERSMHVTSMFNAGREAPFEGEDRDILPSSGDAARAAGEAIRAGKYDFVLVHLAKPDPATQPASPDATLLGLLVDATRSAGAALFITGSSCGGAVPFLYANDGDRTARIREGGSLCDVAPTLLELLEVPPPGEPTERRDTTARSLLLRPPPDLSNLV